MIILKVVLAILLVASTGLQVHAMEHYTNTATDQYGKVVGGAQVSVYLAGTSTLATIYSDNILTAKANPFMTSVTSGVVDFYAENGAYDLVLSAAGKVFTANDTKRITLFDYADLAVTELPVSPFTGQLLIVMDDLTAGACASAGGSSVSLCVWNGDSWVAASSGGGGVAGWPTVSTTKEITWADAFANAALFGNGTNKWALYNDPTDGLQLVCVVAGVANDCNYIRQLANGKTFEIRDSFGGSIFTITESTGAITNAKLDGAGTGNTVILYQKICGGDVAALNPADGTASHVWNKDPLSTAPTLTTASGTNRGTAYLTFPDSDGDYGVQISCEMPALSGTVDAVIWWNTTGTGNARFQIQTKFYADDAADDAAFNTASVVTAAAGTSNRPNRQVLSGLTVTGLGVNSLGRFRFFRNRTEASDTLNAALNVEKVEIWGHVNY